MSVQTELDRIIGAVEAAHLKVAQKGGTTARPYLVGNLEDAIDTIPQGSTEDLDDEIATQKQLIADIQTALQGKAAGGGSLPENLAAVDCGIYTALSTSSATVNVPHKMGVIPDFCLWMIVKSCEGAPVATTNVTGCLVFKPCKLSSSSSDIYDGFQAITGYNASKALARTASAVLSNPMTDTYACIVATTQYRLQAGDSYFWIVGKFKD